MQQFTAIGNLVRDPELSQTKNGKPVCHFALAVQRKYVGQNGERETDFFNCSAFGALADNIGKYCQKGNKIFVRGTIQIRQYEDNQGIMRTAVDVIIDECEFLSSRNARDEE